MYGNKPLTKEQQTLNEQLIQKAIQEAGSRQAALESAIKLAWQHYYRGDPKTAMRRFNQAWLIDPNHADVYYGFAYLLSVQGKTDQAMPLYEKAMELNPTHPLALANLARSYADKAYDLHRRRAPDENVKNPLHKALNLYEKAAQAATTGSNLRLTSLESDLAYIYYLWAAALTLDGRYAEAWEKIQRCRIYGGEKLIKPTFINELSRLMPEPK